MIWRKESQERSLWKQGKLGRDGFSCCNSLTKDGVDDDSLSTESLAYNTRCTRFKVENHFPPFKHGPADIGIVEPQVSVSFSFNIDF